MTEDMRVCSKCLTEYPISQYRKYVTKAGTHCISYVCMSCVKEQNKNGGYFKYRPEKYQARREAQIASTIEWQNRNRERVREVTKKYRNRPENKEAHRKAKRLWYLSNREKQISWGHRRRLLLRSGESYHHDSISRLYAYQEGKCACCGVDFNGNYEVDHIIPLSKNGSNSVHNIQLLCKSCNCSKGNKTPEVFREYLRRHYPIKYEYYSVEAHGVMEFGIK